MRKLLTIALLALPLLVAAQFPDTPRKIRLGYQTNANYLVYVRAGAPDHTPADANDTYLCLDTLNDILYFYDVSAMAWDTITGSGGGGGIDSQTLSFASPNLTISGGNTVSLAPLISGLLSGVDSSIFASVYRVDTASAAIRSEIPTNNNQLTNGAGYITGNQTITLSGDVTGSGETAITTDIDAGAVDWDELSAAVQDSIQAGGNGISGLTTNYIPKATSATTIGNSIMSESSGTIQITDPNSESYSTRSFVVNQPNNAGAISAAYDVFEVRSDGSVKMTDRYGDDLSTTGLHINYFDRRTPAVYIGRSHSNIPAGIGLAVSDNSTGTHDFSGGPNAGGALIAGTTNQNNSVKAGGIFISNYQSENYTANPYSTTYGTYSIGKNASGLNTAGSTKRMVGIYAKGLNSWAVSNTNSISIGLWATASGGQYNYAGIFEDGVVGIGTTAPLYSLDVSTTDGIRLPLGTTAQRPTGADGVIRYNSTISAFEGYSGSAWVRMRAYSYTPSATGDSAGNTGDITYDGSYIYVKTGSGWLRAALSSF